MIHIYYLEKDNIPFYVGKTNNPLIREKSHKRKYGSNIQLIVLSTVNKNNWKFWEQHYISLFKCWGFDLTNKNNGGGGPSHVIITKEHREKTSKSLLGHKHSENTKQKIGYSNKGKLKPQIKQLKEKPITQYNKQNQLIKEWSSALSAIENTNIKGIYNVLTGRAKTAGGFIWKGQSN
jgi:hypothetical protein